MQKRTFLVEILLRARDEISRVAAQAADSLGGVTQAQEDHTRAAEKGTQATGRQAESMRKLHDSHVREKRDLDESTRGWRNLTQAMRDFSVQTKDNRDNLSAISSQFRGLQIAFSIKYAQALISTMVALGGALVSVAAAAGQAAAAVGGALTSAAATAAPVVGLLVASFARVASVLKVVKAQNDQQLVSSRDQQASNDRQRASIDRIRNAQESLADSHRNVAEAQMRLVDAQKAVTEARREGVRQVEDLIAAEEKARRTAEGANLGLEGAQAALRQAVRSGDVGRIGQAQLDVQTARADVAESRVDVRRTREDAAPVRAGGVNALDSVQNANQRVADATRAVADAKRQETRASQDLTRARQDGARAAEQETAAADKLEEMFKRLSPAERDLYKAILRLQGVYRRNFRPITDIIVEAFTYAVARITVLLQDNRVLGAFRSLASDIASIIRKIVDLTTDAETQGLFFFLVKEARRNLPILLDILEDLFEAFRNIARAGAPAFRDLLKFIRDLTGRAADASSNVGALTQYFRDGIVYLKQFTELGIALVQLFLAVSNAGAAKEGSNLLKDLTDRAREATRWVDHHRERVAAFFADARGATGQVGRVLVALGAAVAELFSTRNVETFADFLIHVLIPALTTVIEIMGVLTSIVHQILAQPVIREIAQWVATFLLLTKGLTLLRGALISMIAIVRAGILIFGPWQIVIIALIAAIALLDRKFHFLGPTLRWLKGVAQDVFDWLKEAGADLVDWFSDVWTQGLLKWIRWPFEQSWRGIKWLFRNGIEFIGEAIDWFSENFGEGSTWGALVDLITWPFSAAWDILKLLFRTMKGAVSIFLDAIAGRFGDIGQTIKNIWSDIFGTMYHVIAVVLNKIIGGVNLAIKGLNKVNPFDDIGLIKFHMIENYDAAQFQAEGARRENTGRGRDAPTGVQGAAVGGEFAKQPGGKIIRVAEGGYDEVVLTTDPKHRDRQMGLLGKYLDKIGASYARGGFVQGAQRPSGPSSRAINAILRGLFAQGFNVTSGGEYRGSGTLHDQQAAADFGDSANNLRRLWSILYPARKSFAELFGPTYLNPKPTLMNYGQGFSNPGLQADHQDHIHLGVLSGAADAARRLGRRIGSGAAGAAGVAADVLPAVFRRQITSLIGNNPAKTGQGGALRGGLAGVWDLARRSIRNLRTRARNAYTEGAVATSVGAGVDMNVARTVYGVGVRRNEPFKHLLSAMMIGLVESGMRNLPGGDADSQGWRQERASLYPNPTNVRASSERVYNEMDQLDRGQSAGALAADVQRPAAQYRGRYSEIAGRALALLRRLRRLKRAQGGEIPGFGGGDVISALLEPGEHVLTKEEVARAGGHKVIYALRGMLGGGGQARGDGMQDGGAPAHSAVSAARTTPTLIGSALARQIDRVVDDFVKKLDKTKDLTKKVRQTLARLTEEGGLFDQLAAKIETYTQARATRLSARQVGFNRRRGAFRRADFDEVDAAQFNVQTLQGVRGGLQSTGAAIADEARAARAALREARQDKDKKAIQQAKAALNDARNRARENNAALAQNTQDQVEAIESYQSALKNYVDETASKRTADIERAKRFLTAIGRSDDIAGFAAAEIQNMKDQVTGLQGVVAKARASGNTKFADEVQAQIDDLNVSIVEATMAGFQQRIDDVNTAASRQLADTDVAQRLASIGETNYGAIGSALGSRGGILAAQTAAIQALYDEAAAAGNVDQMRVLGTQLDDLKVATAENTQAVADNTNAAFASRVSDVNNSFGFTSGILGAAGTFFQGLSELTGAPNTATQLSLLRGQTGALGTQRTGLSSALADLLGYNPDEKGRLTAMTGTDLVNYLLSISTGPAYENILGRLDPAQEGQFQELINALIGNASSTNENTKAINELNGQANAQSFRSSYWEAFRFAIFNGAGQLMPNYANAAPRMHSGGMTVRDGLYNLQAGEVITPVSQTNKDSSVNVGEQHDHWHITTPKEVVDGKSLSRETAWARRNRGAR